MSSHFFNSGVMQHVVLYGVLYSTPCDTNHVILSAELLLIQYVIYTIALNIFI